MRVRVRCFALAADLLGGRQSDVELPAGATVGDLLAELGRKFPGFAQLAPRILAAMAEEYVDRSRPLKDGDEVVIIPPVSGGSGV
jgi:molybdopterin synthase catalytic subunit